MQSLQNKIKRDPESYEDEFAMQVSTTSRRSAIDAAFAEDCGGAKTGSEEEDAMQYAADRIDAGPTTKPRTKKGAV